MPIAANGTWVNWTWNTTNMTLDKVVSTTTGNIPWLGIFFLALMYIILVIIFSQEPGRKKYVAITFVGMVISIVFGAFALIPAATIGATAFLFVLTFIIVYATS